MSCIGKSHIVYKDKASACENRKKLILKGPFLFLILREEYMLIIQQDIGLLIFPYLENTERTERMGHITCKTCKSMGGVLCVVKLVRIIIHNWFAC